MKEKFERYIPDMKALDHKFQTSKCFVCSIVQQHLPAHIIFEDDDYIAFLDKYPRQYAYSLIAPKKHLEQVTSDFL